MSVTPVCGAESTVVHTMLARPIVGALICVAGLGAGAYSMTGEPDDFGGCGETGGELHQVMQLTDDPQLVCAVPKEAPVQKEP